MEAGRRSWATAGGLVHVRDRDRVPAESWMTSAASAERKWSRCGQGIGMPCWRNVCSICNSKSWAVVGQSAGRATKHEMSHCKACSPKACRNTEGRGREHAWMAAD